MPKVWGTLLFFLSASSMGSWGQEKPLNVVVGGTLPPYIIQESGKGIEVDILRQALGGRPVNLVYVPFARIPLELAEPDIDAALTVNEETGLRGVYFSDAHITYQNVVITLKDRNLKIAKISDLENLSIAAFQNAGRFLGPDFASMAGANPQYGEVADQKSQVRMLYHGRVDALVADVNIFRFFRKAITDEDISAPVTIAEIFPPTAYKVAFKTKDLRDQFNAGLKKLKASGRYNAILAAYLP